VRENSQECLLEFLVQGRRIRLRRGIGQGFYFADPGSGCFRLCSPAQLIQPDGWRFPMVVPVPANTNVELTTTHEAGKDFPVVIRGFRPHPSAVLRAASGAGVVSSQAQQWDSQNRPDPKATEQHHVRLQSTGEVPAAQEQPSDRGKEGYWDYRSSFVTASGSKLRRPFRLTEASSEPPCVACGLRCTPSTRTGARIATSYILTKSSSSGILW
jgi:hypothetical protein